MGHWRDGAGMIENLKKALQIPELRRRILYTGLLLIVYRFGVHIPIPAVDQAALTAFLYPGVFSVMGRFTYLGLFTVGILPYVSASIILQLLAVVVPRLRELHKEEEGRRKINLYACYATIVLAAAEALAISIGLQGMVSPGGLVVAAPGWGFRIVTTLTLTAGTVFLMWLADQISKRGIGNGIALLIFAGIVTQVPEALPRLLRVGEIPVVMIPFLLCLIVSVAGAIILMDLAQRRITVHYAKRVEGRRQDSDPSTYIPLRVNTAGVVPVIFAAAIIGFPVSLAQLLRDPWPDPLLGAPAFGTIWSTLIYAVAVIFFAYSYTAILFDPAAVAGKMKKYGGFIPDIRPGPDTTEYIKKLMSQLTFVGAFFLVGVSLLAVIVGSYVNTPLCFAGISLVIVVGVAWSTIQEVESRVLIWDYKGFLDRGEPPRCG